MRDRATIDKALATGPTIEASYSTDCVECGGEIGSGESITYSSDAGGWCHTRCTYRLARPVESDVDLS